MSAFFVTSSGTDIGKTFLTCALIWQYRQKNRAIHAVKPVISGFDKERIAHTDTGQILHALGLAINDDQIDEISPWRFVAPLAANMAAKQEERNIVFDDVVRWCKKEIVTHKNKTLLIEGAGGVMAPACDSNTMLDLIVALRIPAVLVGGTYLGSISHTLTAYMALKHAGIRCHAIAVSESVDSTVSSKESLKTLRNFIHSEIPIYFAPYVNSVDDAWKNLPDDLTHILE
jgi:dethiobiotin synthetase